MKTVGRYLSLFLVSLAMFTPTAQAGESEDVCSEWCETVTECKFCSLNRGCGSGNTSIGSVSIHYNSSNPRAYGCGTSAVGRFEPTSNETMCLRFITTARKVSLYREQMEDAYCSSKRSCRKGFTNFGSFTGGVGKNMHACALSSVMSKDECEKYCQETTRCDKCISKNNCGSGYSKIAQFDDWSACELNNRGHGGNANERDCKKWCEDNNVCNKCSPDTGCGRGYKRINTFKEHRPGKNWYACEKR